MESRQAAGVVPADVSPYAVSAALLAVQRDRANWNFQRAQTAERDALAKLGDSYLAQARAGKLLDYEQLKADWKKRLAK